MSIVVSNRQSKRRSAIADLPSGVGVSKTTNGAGRFYWRVRLGKRFTGGRVIKRDFDSVSAARNWIFGDAEKEKARPGSIVDLRKNHGDSAFMLSAAQLAEAANAFRRVEKWGFSLTAALDLAERYRPPVVGTVSLEEAIRRCAVDKQKRNRAPTTIYDLKSKWKRFAKWLPAPKREAVHSITRDDITRFVKSCEFDSSVTERNMVRCLSSLFSWAATEKLLSENPTDGWDFREARNTLARDREPRVLSIPEAEKILRVAATGSKNAIQIGGQKMTIEPSEMIPYVAIGMFGGLRPYETRRISWEHIWWGEDDEHHEAQIEVPAAITKTGHTRYVPMEPVLAEWLKPYRKNTGKIVPPAFERKFQAFSKLCWGDEGWPEDILRHSYASYLLARDKDAGTVAENLGHRDTTSTLFRHYRNAIKFKRDIAAYWSRTPDTLSLLF